MWLALAIVRMLGLISSVTLIDLLLLLAPLVLVPIGLSLAYVNTPIAVRALDWARASQPIGAIASVIAFLLPLGTWSGVVALVWTAVCGLCALAGLLTILERRSLHAEALVAAASLAYLSVGALWLAISRFGLHPLQLSSDIVELTSVHFHYAGFVALTMATCLMLYTRDEPLPHRYATVAGLAVVLGSPLIAVGFVVLPIMLVVGAAMLVMGIVVLALVTLVAVVPTTRCQRGKAALALSSSAVFLPMILALSYAAGRVFKLPALSVHAMAAVHGSLNAFGFALCGLAGWHGLGREHTDADAQTEGAMTHRTPD